MNEIYTLLVGIQNSMEISQMVKQDMPDNLPVIFLHMYSKEMKSGNQRYTCTSLFIAVLFSIAA